MSGEGNKFDQDKPRMDLVPTEAVFAMAHVLTYGAKKYSVEAENEWQRLLLVTSADGIQLTIPGGCVVSVTRNTYGQPIPSLQSASVKIEGIGKPGTQIKSAPWPSVDALIRQHVLGTSKQNGSLDLGDMDSPKSGTMSYALKGVQSVERPSICTLTIATPQGDLEVSFAPDAITGSDFWTTVWKALNEHFGISRPQNKTGERNWELGMDWGRVYAALLRHLLAWWDGEDVDPESNMPHLWHVMCCAAFLTTYEQRNLGKDDRPNTKD